MTDTKVVRTRQAHCLEEIRQVSLESDSRPHQNQPNNSFERMHIRLYLTELLPCVVVKVDRAKHAMTKITCGILRRVPIFEEAKFPGDSELTSNLSFE